MAIVCETMDYVINGVEVYRLALDVSKAFDIVKLFEIWLSTSSIHFICICWLIQMNQCIYKS